MKEQRSNKKHRKREGRQQNGGSSTKKSLQKTEAQPRVVNDVFAGKSKSRSKRGSGADNEAEFSSALQKQLNRLHDKLQQDSTARSVQSSPSKPALAAGWEEFVTADGKPYYYNTATEVTSWNRPQ